MKTFIFGVFSFSLFLTSCADPAANKTKANVSNASNATANTTSNSTAAPGKTETLTVTPENSKVEFTASKVTASHPGGFKKFDGSIDLVNDKPEGSRVKIDIDLSSVFTNEEKLSEHLKTPDFFDVAKFPKANFTSTSIASDAAKGADNYTVTGDFDLHGQKKSINFPAVIKVDAGAVTVTSEFSINRKDFGLVYPGFANDLINDLVVIKLDLKAPRKK
ncbi:MAG: YceI family protein [Acidobacteriota bacterium]